MIIVLVFLALSSPIAVGKTQAITHTYLQDVRSGICAYARQNQAVQHTKAASPDIILNFKKAVQGATLDETITLSPWFVPKSIMYVLGFVALWMTLRKIKINLALRGKDRAGAEVQVKYPCLHGTLCIVTILCILSALFYACKGIFLASEIEAASASFICHFLHFPDQFSRDPGNPATFNDYQFAATKIGTSFGSVQARVKSLRTISSSENFTDQSKKIMGEDRALESLFELNTLLGLVERKSEEMVWLVSNLREVLLQLRGFLFLVPSFINSSIRIEKVPNIIKSSISQFYTVMALVTFMTLLILCVILFGRHLRRLWILQFPPLLMGCSFFTALILALCGNLVLVLGGNACNIFAQYPKKSQLFEVATKKVHFEEELMKQTVREVLRKTQPDSDGNFATLDSQLYRSYDKVIALMGRVQDYKPRVEETEENIEWVEQMRQYQKLLQQIRSSILDVQDQGQKDGEFGRLSLRPYGNYFQGLSQSICSHNHILWSSNHSTCLTMAFWLLLALLSYYLLLCCSKEGFQKLPSEEDGIQLGRPNSPSQEGSGHVYI